MQKRHADCVTESGRGRRQGVLESDDQQPNLRPQITGKDEERSLTAHLDGTRRHVANADGRREEEVGVAARAQPERRGAVLSRRHPEGGEAVLLRRHQNHLVA